MGRKGGCRYAFLGPNLGISLGSEATFLQIEGIMRIVSKKFPSGVSIEWHFFLNISTVLGFRPKQLSAYVEMVCKVYNNKALTH